MTTLDLQIDLSDTTSNIETFGNVIGRTGTALDSGFSSIDQLRKRRPDGIGRQSTTKHIELYLDVVRTIGTALGSGLGSIEQL